MRIHKRLLLNKSGQAVIMVGVSLIAMSGLMGLAVDLGWSYFVQRMEQSAADAGAMAGANAGLDDLVSGTVSSYSNLATSCCSLNLGSARTYALNNGFQQGGDGGRQTVMIDGGVPPVPAGWAPGVNNIRYWTRVRITTTIPQLFSAVLGNSTGTVGASAMAAIADAIVNGSLIAMNRENDGVLGGQNISIGGGGHGTGCGGLGADICAGGGIMLSSTTIPDGGHGVVGDVVARGTYAQPSGFVGSFQHQADGPQFLDPMRGKGQPPVPSNLPAIPVLGNVISPDSVPAGVCSKVTGVCQQGIYFATGPPPGCKACAAVATGQQLTVSPSVTSFGSGSTWGDYVFYGGLSVNTNLQLGPGRFIMAGAGTDAGGVAMDVSANISPTSPSDAGTLVILTDTNYPGLSALFNAANLSAWSAMPLGFGDLLISGEKTTVTLNGLDRGQTLPGDTNGQGLTLSDFAPAVIWQDQRSSIVKYTSTGNIDTSCGSINSPCTNSSPPAIAANKPGIDIKNSSVTLNGMVYQPRGSWLKMEPGNGGILSGGLVLITGGVSTQGTSYINLGQVTLPPPLTRITTLIQ